MLTIKELKTLIEVLPDDMPVVVNGYEGDYDDVASAAIVPMGLYVQNDEHMGKHRMEAGEHKCLLLSRGGLFFWAPPNNVNLLFGKITVDKDWLSDEDEE